MLIPSEYEECCTLVDYLEFLKKTGRITLYTHTAQETYTKSWSVKIKNKKSGVRKGFPDYCIVSPQRLFFVEMKRIKGSKTSPQQDEWIDAINATGVPARVCHGFLEAKDFINEQIA